MDLGRPLRERGEQRADDVLADGARDRDVQEPVDRLLLAQAAVRTPGQGADLDRQGRQALALGREDQAMALAVVEVVAELAPQRAAALTDPSRATVANVASWRRVMD
jgi:hypothetical protein